MKALFYGLMVWLLLVVVVVRWFMGATKNGGSHEQPKRVRKSKGIRPCIEATLNAKSVHDPAHPMKVAAVAELHAEGVPVEDIVARFSGMEGFSEDKTRYFVEHAIRRGYRPYRCATIQQMGGCLGSECRCYKEAA